MSSKDGVLTHLLWIILEVLSIGIAVIVALWIVQLLASR